MAVAVVGGSGLVGRALTRSIVADSGEVVMVLSRDARRRADRVKPPARIIRWSPGDVDAMARSIAGVDAVVDLAGARVAPWPWTRRRKRVIESSRVDAVRTIVDAVASLPPDTRPASLLVVSGVDAYPASGAGADTPMSESTPMGTAFLAQVSRAVEEEARRAESLGVRVVRMRMGHVLARDADLVWFLALPVRLFLGGRLGSGRQWLSWIHIDDAVGLFRLAIDGVVDGGVLNVTSPGACRQIDFARSMARVLHRPARFPAPAWLVRLVLGEQAALLLESRRVAPARATALGYAFRYPEIDAAIDDVLG